MHFKVLACDVFTREISWCIARCPHSISVNYTPRGEHNKSDRLRLNLQQQIDAVEQEEIQYDAVLLAYGLCGNAILGIEARNTPVVIPRAHDCTTLFLGSKEAFVEHFGDNPSQTWATVGYAERSDSIISDSSAGDHLGLPSNYDELVEQYGEENAQFLLEALRTEHGSDELFIIDIPETHIDMTFEWILAQAEGSGLKPRILTGNMRLFEGLVAGEWDDEDYLVLPPGHKVTAVYDMNRIIDYEPYR